MRVLPEHRLLRSRRVRHPGGGAGVLRQAREGPDAGRGHGARRHHQEPRPHRGKGSPFDPNIDKQQATDRLNYIKNQMIKLNFVKSEEAEAKMAYPAKVITPAEPGPTRSRPGQHGQARGPDRAPRPRRGGQTDRPEDRRAALRGRRRRRQQELRQDRQRRLKIVTTIDPKLQQAAVQEAPAATPSRGSTSIRATCRPPSCGRAGHRRSRPTTAATAATAATSPALQRPGAQQRRGQLLRRPSAGLDVQGLHARDRSHGRRTRSTRTGTATPAAVPGQWSCEEPGQERRRGQRLLAEVQVGRRQVVHLGRGHRHVAQRAVLRARREGRPGQGDRHRPRGRHHRHVGQRRQQVARRST